MVAQRQELVVRQFSFIPTTFNEMQEYAKYIASSGACPNNFKGRPADVAIVIQVGFELGLKPMQALRILGVINGMPFAYGDGLFALVKRHSEFENANEWFEGTLQDETLTAFCKLFRKGKDPVIQQFSIEDAKRAQLWDKKDNWKLYPRRMLQHRARNFAARDQFPEALFGLLSEDEVLNIMHTKASKPISKGMKGVEESLGINDPIDANFEVIENVNVEKDMLLSELRELILTRNVPDRVIESWLKKCNVERLEDLKIEIVKKGIDHFKKELKNEV